MSLNACPPSFSPRRRGIRRRCGGCGRRWGSPPIPCSSRSLSSPPWDPYIRAGVLRPDDIAGDLFELTRGTRAGRRFHDQITLFKSVGTALEDLAAAQLALKRVTT